MFTRALCATFLALLLGCTARSPQRVAQLAQQAEVDPRKLARLVNALDSADQATWHEAYMSLVDMGLAASGALQDAVLEKHPARGRAILALGEMGEPANFPFMNEALAVPELRRYAEEAFLIAEQVLLERLGEERQLALCDAYLEWFPQGSRREQTVLLRHELLAEEAWSRLGRKPGDAEIMAFLYRYGDTPTGVRARAVLTKRMLADAGRELARGRLDEALSLVREARRVDPEADLDAMEAAVRLARGKEALAGLRLDSAVRELEQAQALAPSDLTRGTLGRAYMDRARRGFAVGQDAAGLLDLERAERTDATLATQAGELRQQRIAALLLRLERESPPAEGLVEALVIAGPHAQQDLERAIWKSLALGDSSVLEQVVDAAVVHGKRRDGELTRRWCSNVVERALSEAEGDAQLLLAHPPAQATLFEPQSFVSAAYASTVEEAARQLRRYVAVVSVAHYHVQRLGPVRGPLPAAPPLLENEVAGLFRGGHDGRDALGLPPLTRAQLMLYQVNRIGRLHSALRQRAAGVAAEILQTGLAPFALPEWVRILDGADRREGGRTQRIELPGGDALKVSAQRTGRTLNLQAVATSCPRAAPPEAWIGGALGVLFSMARPVMAADEDLQRIEVQWSCLDQDSSSGESQALLELAFSRRSVGRIDWDLVQDERPYRSDHLMLVPDHRLH